MSCPLGKEQGYVGLLRHKSGNLSTKITVSVQISARFGPGRALRICNTTGLTHRQMRNPFHYW